jgi:hypothetical protein
MYLACLIGGTRYGENTDFPRKMRGIAACSQIIVITSGASVSR